MSAETTPNGAGEKAGAVHQAETQTAKGNQESKGWFHRAATWLRTWLGKWLGKWWRDITTGFEGMKKDTAPRNWGCTMIFFACILFVVLFVLENTASGAALKSFATILGILAGALLTAGFFSVLLGFNEFVKYTTDILVNIVRDPSYIARLSEDTKKDLRYHLDAVFYGDSAVKNIQGPYRFLTEQYTQIYSAPYRTQYLETVIINNACAGKKGNSAKHTTFCANCREEENEERDPKQQSCVKTTTDYVLHFAHVNELNKKDKPARQYPISVPVGTSLTYYSSDLITHLKLSKLSLCGGQGRPQAVETPEQDRLSTDYPYYPVLRVRIRGRSASTEQAETDQSISLVFKRVEKEGQLFLQFDLQESEGVDAETITRYVTKGCYPITAWLDSHHEGRLTAHYSTAVELHGTSFLNSKVDVKIEEVTFDCRLDTSRTTTMVYPTHGLTVSYSILDNENTFLFDPTGYSMSDKVLEPTVEANSVTFSMSDWLIKGHGYALQWVPLKNGTASTAAAPPEGGTASGRQPARNSTAEKHS